MDFKTAHSRIIPYLFILALVLMGCRKEDQETLVHIRCVTPHDNQPVKGCKVTITEGKMKGKSLSVGFDPIQEFSGITDENGVATIRFHYKKNNKFQYKLSNDNSGITPPNGMTDIDVMLPKGWTDYLDKKQFEFNYEFRVFGKCGIHRKFVNMNCLNASDSMKFDSEFIDQVYGTPFFPESYSSAYIGCGEFGEYTSPIDEYSTGRLVFKLKIYRNGMEQIIYDTIVLNPNTINEAIIEY